MNEEGIYPMQEERASLYADIIARLAALGETVCTAESCTGGNIARCLASVSGASAVFVAGLVAYAPQVKVSELGVDPVLVSEQNIVRCSTAMAMACGARRRFKTDWALATTGFAGPGGGNDLYPVGTVCMALLCPRRRLFITRTIMVKGGRENVMQNASDALLDLFRKYLW